jgi:hypothetical protein
VRGDHESSDVLLSLLDKWVCACSHTPLHMSPSHAAWDGAAVHGVHATYGVSNLGTAFGFIAQ